MKILIIEDEHHAVKRLKNLLANLIPNEAVITHIDSVKEALIWFDQYPAPDLIFLDIQLADGLSFDILQKVDIDSPIIFTTAFEEYAIRAFKTNSIDYLLKPIDADELKTAWEKYNRLHASPKKIPFEMIKDLERSLSQKKYTTRFIIKSGKQLKYITVDNIWYFFSEDGMSFLFTQNGNKHVIDHTMESLENRLDPELFFRINRKMILHLDSILSISPYFNNRLVLKLKSSSTPKAIVSREKVKAFKSWLGD